MGRSTSLPLALWKMGCVRFGFMKIDKRNTQTKGEEEQFIVIGCDGDWGVINGALG